MINHYLPLIAGVFLCVLAFVVVTNRRIDRYHAYFSLFLFMAAAWSVGVGLFFLTSVTAVAYWLVIGFYVAALLISYSVLIFARATPGLKGAKKSKGGTADLILLLPVAAFAVWMITSRGFLYGVSADGVHNGYRLAPVPYLLYGTIFVTYVTGALAILVRKYSVRGTRAGHPYQVGLRLVAVSIMFGTGFGAIFNLILPIFGIYSLIWVGPVGIIPSAFIFWYAILRHGFFDIRLIVVRTLGYVLSILTLAVVYVLLAYLVTLVFLQGSLAAGVAITPINIVFALILAFIFQPVKTFFDRITDNIFYRNRYKPEEFIALLSNILSTTTELRDLLVKASDVIALTMKSRQVFFVVNYPGHGYVTSGTRGHEAFSADDIRRLRSQVDSVRGKVVVTDQLQPRTAAHQILASSHVALLLPLWHNGEVIGCLALGDSLSGQYLQRDVRLLETIADELVIAIQNAFSLEEVRDTNAHLEQRIDTATHSLRRSNQKLRKLDDAKDEFISMASHQLRTPLTSVKGYISMILAGDAGEVNETQRRFLTEAFESSNRMAGIIGDFLNVSRLQTGKFTLEREPVDLAAVVEGEVRQLQNTAGARGTRLTFRRPAHFPHASLDKTKVEQVVMNFIDNAIFYAPETGDIDIELFQRAGRAVFTVRDHGIGVPKAEQASLFTKFFRATNARRKRPDGTGVGLFLARKVVMAHGGAIIFESSEGKGSTFGFEIPLREA